MTTIDLWQLAEEMFKFDVELYADHGEIPWLCVDKVFYEGDAVVALFNWYTEMKDKHVGLSLPEIDIRAETR